MNTERLNDKKEIEYQVLTEEHLSRRARNILDRLGVSSVSEMLQLQRENLLATAHCGEKSADEIINLCNNTQSLTPAHNLLNKCRSCFPPEEQGKAFNALAKGLNARAQTLLREYGIETADDFLEMPMSKFPSKSGVGETTLESLHNMRYMLMEFLQDCKSIDKDERIRELCKLIFKKTVSETEDWELDKERVYDSLLRWVHSVAKGKERSELSFLLRTGLNDEPATTLEAAGKRLGITRERVRQLNREFQEMAEWEVHQRRLESIIERMLEIIDSNGGEISKSEMLRELSSNGSEYEKLHYAVPFLDFLSTLPISKEFGLKCGPRHVYKDVRQS